MAAINLKTRTARGKLTPQHAPYWEALQRGLAIGYRKNAGEHGTWIGRRAGPDRKYQFQTVGDESTLEYGAACKAVTTWDEELASGVLHQRKNLTVADVCRKYVENRRKEKGGNTAYDAERRFMRYVYPETCALEAGALLPDGTKKRKSKRRGDGDREVSATKETRTFVERPTAFVYESPIGDIPFFRLQPHDVERWRNAQLDHEDPDDEESYNQAKDSINRNLKTLKAAFNYGKDTLNLVTSDKAWKTIKMFKGKGGKIVGARREGYLNQEQRATLLAVMQPDLRKLATALLLIGARPGELGNADLQDFDKIAGKLTLEGKTGKRTILLSTRATDFLREATKDRIGNAPLFVRDNGERWTAPHWGKDFRTARELAKMPDVVMYYMRHTYISSAIKAGLNIYTIAEQTGTSVAIIESNYFTEPEGIVESLDKVAIL